MFISKRPIERREFIRYSAAALGIIGAASLLPAEKAHADPPVGGLGTIYWGATASDTWQGITFTGQSGLEVAPGWGVTAYNYIRASAVVGPQTMGVCPMVLDALGSVVTTLGYTYYNTINTWDHWCGGRMVGSSGNRYMASGTYSVYGEFWHQLMVPRTGAVLLSIDKGFAQNENGQTYGSLAQASSARQMPVLVEAVANNGQRGYIYASDMGGLNPVCHGDEQPGENNLFEYEVPTKTLNVFAEDGCTIIGEMVIGGELLTGQALAS